MRKRRGKKAAGLVNIWSGFFSMKRKKVISHPVRRSEPLKNVSDLAWPVTRAWGWPRLFNCNMCFLLAQVRESCSAIKECEGYEGAEKQKKEVENGELDAGNWKKKWTIPLALLFKNVRQKRKVKRSVCFSIQEYSFFFFLQAFNCGKHFLCVW